MYEQIVGKTGTGDLDQARSDHRHRFAWLAARIPDHIPAGFRPPALPAQAEIDRWWQSIGKDKRTAWKIMYAAVIDNAPAGAQTDFQKIAWWRSLGSGHRKKIRARYEGKSFFEDVVDVVKSPVLAAIAPTTILPIQAAIAPRETFKRYAPVALPVAMAAAPIVLGPAAPAAMPLLIPALSALNRAAQGDLKAQSAIAELGKAALANVPQAQAAAAVLEHAGQIQQAAAAAQRLVSRTDPEAKKAVRAVATAAQKGSAAAQRIARTMVQAKRATAPSSALVNVLAHRIQRGDGAAKAFVNSLAQSTDPASREALAELQTLISGQAQRGQWQRTATGAEAFVPEIYARVCAGCV